MKATASLKLSMERPPKHIVDGLKELATTAIADLLKLESVVRHAIRPLWTPIPRIAGPAFTVRTARHDNLMLHAAIYHAEAGDVIVVEAGDDEMAVAGGNVCAVAQRRGVAGLIVDGAVRDVGESRANGFPLYARGRSPIPAGKDGPGDIGVPIVCGGARVHPGDVVVADEEGIVIVAKARAEALLREAIARTAKDAAESLDDWERRHRARVENTLRARGYLS